MLYTKICNFEGGVRAESWTLVWSKFADGEVASEDLVNF
jgi:hypothetical protein